MYIAMNQQVKRKQPLPVPCARTVGFGQHRRRELNRTIATIDEMPQPCQAKFSARIGGNAGRTFFHVGGVGKVLFLYD